MQPYIKFYNGIVRFLMPCTARLSCIHQRPFKITKSNNEIAQSTLIFTTVTQNFTVSYAVQISGRRHEL